MQIATCRVRLSELSDVPYTGLTPAEALLLEKLHHKNANGQVIHGARLTADERRNDAQEIDRLKQKYGPKHVLPLFPGAAPRLPETFAEIGLEVAPSEYVEPAPPAPVPSRSSRPRHTTAVPAAAVNDD